MVGRQGLNQLSLAPTLPFLLLFKGETVFLGSGFQRLPVHHGEEGGMAAEVGSCCSPHLFEVVFVTTTLLFAY